MTNWIITRSSAETKPFEIDTTSSEYYVYERRNIHQEERTEPSSDLVTKEWVYEERQYTKDEYSDLNSATTQLLMQNMSDMAVDIAILKEVVS